MRVAHHWSAVLTPEIPPKGVDNIHRSIGLVRYPIAGAASPWIDQSRN